VKLLIRIFSEDYHGAETESTEQAMICSTQATITKNQHGIYNTQAHHYIQPGTSYVKINVHSYQQNHLKREETLIEHTEKG